ncbi:MAG: hypothetical protein PHR79_02630 [Bacteroidales bacterium]|nr:hypothetical protein [Bacteroidales bacterium]
MNKTIFVTKGQNQISLQTEQLENSDIVLKKTTKGENYEIILRRFSDDEISELYQAIDAIYEDVKQSKLSFKERFEVLWK